MPEPAAIQIIGVDSGSLGNRNPEEGFLRIETWRWSPVLRESRYVVATPRWRVPFAREREGASRTEIVIVVVVGVRRGEEEMELFRR
jgi:hypothetical protein